jgi:VWFA-related protein
MIRTGGPKVGPGYGSMLLFLILAIQNISMSQDAVQLPKPLQHDVTVVNIAVPTRVFNGDRFVDNLTANDFIVLENGVVQKVEAAYLIRKTSVLQNATVVGSSVPVPVPVEKPDESLRRRHFVLVFEMDDYLPQLSQAVDMFCSEVLAPNDTLRVITPENEWEIKKGPVDKASRLKLADDLKSKLRKSITLSSSQLKRLLMDLRAKWEILKSDMEVGGRDIYTDVEGTRNIIEQIVFYKSMDVRHYEEFARLLKPLDGQKNAIIFYQKESYVIPAIYKKAFDDTAELRQNSIDLKAIEKMFADSGATVHFFYVTKTKSIQDAIEFRDSSEAVMGEMSGDFYSTFRNLAIATGGVSVASANPIYGFKRALDASENYYLVFYAPSDYKADGKYKEIEVKVKSGRYRVDHRAGYIDK